MPLAARLVDIAFPAIPAGIHGGLEEGAVRDDLAARGGPGAAFACFDAATPGLHERELPR